MNEIKNILFLIITLTLLLSCNNKGPGPGERHDSNFDDTIQTDTGNIDETNSGDSGNCIPDSNGRDLEMTLKAQEQYFWCWAASGEMVMENLGDTITQCDEANKCFGRQDCCNSRLPFDCDEGGWPEFEKYGYTADTTDDKALSWTNVTKQIDCQMTPFCVTWKWNEGGGHMMVVSAYKKIDGDSMVKIHDPYPVGTGSLQWIRYSEYVIGPGYTHWDDFFNIRKR